MQAVCKGLQCRDCGKIVPESIRQKCHDCGAPLRVIFDPASLKKAIKASLAAPSQGNMLTQWLPILPIADLSLIDKVSLGERETPLLPSRKIGQKIGIENLHFKVEQGPTLSLKDRGTSLCILKALEFGADTVCLASSGNNASSVSGYGTSAGLILQLQNRKLPV